MNRGDIKLCIDRCDAHDVPDAARMLEKLADDREVLLAALKWLSRWLGDKPMPVCVGMINGAIARVSK